MSVESSFFKDRPATSEELRSLPSETPDVTGVSEFEDLCKVTVVESLDHVEANGDVIEHSYLENWFFRTN